MAALVGRAKPVVISVKAQKLKLSGGGCSAKYSIVKVLRNGVKLVLRELRWPRLTAGTSMLLWSIGGSGVAGLHPFDFSSRLRASRRCGQVLRSADIKAHGGDGRGDLRGGSFGRPVFAGVRGENLARTRSWPAAELSVWRATRSRGGWPAGPVKLRRLTGPGGRSWGAELGRGAGRRRHRPSRRRRGVDAKAKPSWVALPAGTELHRNAGAECRGAKLAGRHEVGAKSKLLWGRAGRGRKWGAKLAGVAQKAVAQSWRIARNCLKGFTPFRTSQDR